LEKSGFNTDAPQEMVVPNNGEEDGIYYGNHSVSEFAIDEPLISQVGVS